MAINNFSFTAEDVTEVNEGYKNSSNFPDPVNETQTRKQLQMLLSQIRKYLNETLIPGVNNLIPSGVEYKNNATVQANPLKFVRMTQAQYSALVTKDSNTLYIIIG